MTEYPSILLLCWDRFWCQLSIIWYFLPGVYWAAFGWGLLHLIGALDGSCAISVAYWSRLPLFALGVICPIDYHFGLFDFWYCLALLGIINTLGWSFALIFPCASTSGTGWSNWTWICYFYLVGCLPNSYEFVIEILRSKLCATLLDYVGFEGHMLITVSGYALWECSQLVVGWIFLELLDSNW